MESTLKAHPYEKFELTVQADTFTDLDANDLPQLEIHAFV